VKRRDRLIGPNGSTLKAIELLTDCEVFVQGKTVTVLGKASGLKQVRKVAEECMTNVHPIYNIKSLMIKRELAKDAALVNEDWSRFLPKFKKQNKKIKKKVKPKKKEYTPFPPPQTPRKVDLQLESGEYFLSEKQREQKKREEKFERQKLNKIEKEKAKGEDYKPPKETKKAPVTSVEKNMTMNELKSNIDANLKKRKTPESTTQMESSKFILKKKKSKTTE